MPLEITQKQLMQVLTQQAIIWFGEEQARDLHAQLEERAAYLWLLSQHLPNREQEPDFLCSIAHNLREE
jgi:citrate synthase